MLKKYQQQSLAIELLNRHAKVKIVHQATGIPIKLRYQVSKRTIYRWMKLENNPFPQPKINQAGTTCLWDPDEIEAWGSRASKTA
jgi:predicted DNA-binding transcriptional regulator AlpA